MAKVHIGAGPTNLSDGLLQLENGDAMDATLRIVTDQNNTTSPLKLSTGLVSVSSTLQIATSDTQYLDAEDLGGNNRFTISRNAGSQVVNVDFASNPTLGTDQVGAIRTYQNGVSLSDAIGFQKNGQVTFTERVKIEADSTSTTQSAAVIQSTTTNAGLVLQPNGTGAIMATVPDGTATGGNARAQYAVDLQLFRTAADQVASGDYSTLLGGERNRSTSRNTTVAGGRENSANAQYSTISGGQSNTASTNSHATVVGGQSNTASGQYSVAGGYSNTASGQGSVALGNSNIASGFYSTISGGSGNSTGQTYATIVGGYQNTASQTYSIAGGWNATASGQYSVAMGRNVTASGAGSAAFGFNGAATADGAFRTGAFGGSMPYANGVLHGGTINTACGRVLVPLNFDNIQLAAGATATKTLNLDLIYSSFAVFGLEVCTVLYQDGGAPAPLANRDPFFQKDLFCISATGSTTCAIVGSVVNVIKQGAAAMLTGSITYSVTGTVLTITFTAPTGYAGTSAFSGEIDVQFTFYSG